MKLAHYLLIILFTIAISSCQSSNYKSDVIEFSDTLIIEEISDWSRTHYSITAYSISNNRREGYSLYTDKYEGSSIEELTADRTNKRVAVKLRIEPYNSMLSITNENNTTYNIAQLGTEEIAKTVKGKLILVDTYTAEDINEPDSMYVENSNGVRLYFKEYLQMKEIATNIDKEVTVTYTTGNTERISYIKVLEDE